MMLLTKKLECFPLVTLFGSLRTFKAWLQVMPLHSALVKYKDTQNNWEYSAGSAVSQFSQDTLFALPIKIRLG